MRAAAIALFGDLVAAMAGREPSSLRTQVHQGLVPLLLHLRDRCPAVATVSACGWALALRGWGPSGAGSAERWVRWGSRVAPALVSPGARLGAAGRRGCGSEEGAPRRAVGRSR